MSPEITRCYAAIASLFMYPKQNAQNQNSVADFVKHPSTQHRSRKPFGSLKLNQQWHPQLNQRLFALADKQPVAPVFHEF